MSHPPKKTDRILPLRSPEHCYKLSQSRKGKCTGESNPSKRLEIRKKISIANAGNTYSLGVKRPNFMQENNPNWKGGKTPLNFKIRILGEYKIWRQSVMRRDKYTCQICEIRGGLLHVDHIVPFAVIVHKNRVTSIEEALNCEELWDTNNGRTLCISCHHKTPTWGHRTATLLADLVVQPMQ